VGVSIGVGVKAPAPPAAVQDKPAENVDESAQAALGLIALGGLALLLTTIAAPSPKVSVCLLELPLYSIYSSTPLHMSLVA
jgi:hypothetical protein